MKSIISTINKQHRIIQKLRYRLKLLLKVRNIKHKNDKNKLFKFKCLIFMIFKKKFIKNGTGIRKKRILDDLIIEKINYFN